MKRLILFILLLCSLIIAAPAAEDGEKQNELTAIAASIEEIGKRIEEFQKDDARLVRLRSDLEATSTGLISFGISLRPQLREINERLDEIGAPPAQDAPAEPEILTQERNALQVEKSSLNSLLGEAEQLSINSAKLIDQIATLRREIFANSLFRRTEVSGAISTKTWSAFTRELSSAWSHITSRFQFMYSFRTNELLTAIGLSLAIGIPAYFGIRAVFRLMLGLQDQQAENSYIARLSLAFWSTVIPSLAFGILLAGVYWLFTYFGVFSRQIGEIAEALLISLAAIFFIQRLAFSLFSPADPKRRLVAITDRAARTLVLLILSLAVIHVLDFFFGRLNVIFTSPLSLTVAKSLVSSLAISMILILIVMVKPFRDPETGEAEGWAIWVRIPLVLVSAFIIAVTAAGYIGLARFTAAQVVITGAILATMFIGVQSGHVLAAEGVFPASSLGKRLKSKFSLSDTALDQMGLLLSFVIYIMVVIVGFPLILLQWGFDRIDIQTWLLRVLTDIRIGTISISLIGIVFGLVIFAIGFVATRKFQHWLDRSVMARGRIDAGVRNSVGTIIGYAGIAIAALIGLSAAGFDLTNLALIAGALSLGIGFGLQSVVNNFVSGLILLAERPFKVGDWIVAGTSAGFVRKISVRATEIETFQNQTVILPNSELINSAVGNWMHRNHRARVEIPVGVAYGAKPREVHALLLEIADNDPDVLKQPPPVAVFKDFGPSSLDFELRVHISEVLDSMVVATRLRFEIVDVFEANGIQIPFPQSDVHLKSGDLKLQIDDQGKSVTVTNTKEGS